MRRLVSIYALLFSFLFANIFAKDDFKLTNRLVFGYQQSFSSFSDTITFKGNQAIDVDIKNTLYNPYIGIETQFLSWLSMLNTFSFGNISSKKTSDPKDIYWHDAQTIIQRYNFLEYIPEGLFFNYEPTLRFYLGIPYIFIDLGLSFGVHHVEKYQLTKISLPISTPHVFLHQKSMYMFTAGSILSFGLSVPLFSSGITLEGKVFIASLLNGKITRPKFSDNTLSTDENTSNISSGFSVGLKVDL